MFEKLIQLPADPILGLITTFNEDSHVNKINLSVGVYQDSSGNTPIFSAIKKAEAALFELEQTKVYAPQAGDPTFVKSMSSMLLGDNLIADLGDRVTTVMTPGGCGALHLAAKLISQGSPNAKVWVSTPTWGNHFPLLESSGVTLEEYAYYDQSTRSVNFQAMLDSLSQIPQGDAVLLHGCCHNPTGADLTPEQWDQLIDLFKQQQLVPFIDVAYQGFGDGLEQDAYGIRQAAAQLPEVIVASSCSKNFGVYRERVGAITVITESATQTQAANSQLLAAARCVYSMPPSHGGAVVGHLLADDALKTEWQSELEQIRLRINTLRLMLMQGLNDKQSHIDFSFLSQSKGMFCYLGILKDDILRLRAEFGIYLLESGRINIAGLSEHNIDVVIDRVSQVIQR